MPTRGEKNPRHIKIASELPIQFRCRKQSNRVQYEGRELWIFRDPKEKDFTASKKINFFLLIKTQRQDIQK